MILFKKEAVDFSDDLTVITHPMTFLFDVSDPGYAMFANRDQFPVFKDNWKLDASDGASMSKPYYHREESSSKRISRFNIEWIIL